MPFRHYRYFYHLCAVLLPVGIALVSDDLLRWTMAISLALILFRAWREIIQYTAQAALKSFRVLTEVSASESEAE